jgi:hypothetical protein
MAREDVCIPARSGIFLEDTGTGSYDTSSRGLFAGGQVGFGLCLPGAGMEVQVGIAVMSVVGR